MNKEEVKISQHKKTEYFMTLFKVKNHDTWRACLKLDADGFEREVRANMSKVEVTDTKLFIIDRVNGTIHEKTKEAEVPEGLAPANEGGGQAPKKARRKKGKVE